MNRFTAFFLTCFFATVFLTGCLSLNPSPAAVENSMITVAVEDDVDAAAQVSQMYMEGFVDAFRNNNYERFLGILSPDKQKDVTPEKFQEIRDASLVEQGRLISAEPVTMLEKVIYQNFVWKLTYEKEDAQQNPEKREYLFYIRVGNIGEGRYSIGAAGFCL